MKFNEVKTADALKQSLSDIDFSADVLDGHPWWTHMHTSKPDANATSTLSAHRFRHGRQHRNKNNARNGWSTKSRQHDD